MPCFFFEIPIYNANSVDPDQTPQNAASDQGLHCLQMSLLLNARHKCFICGYHSGTISPNTDKSKPEWPSMTELGAYNVSSLYSTTSLQQPPQRIYLTGLYGQYRELQCIWSGGYWMSIVSGGSIFFFKYIWTATSENVPSVTYAQQRFR